MSEPKTKVNDASVVGFINALEDETKKQDSLKLLEIYTKITGKKAKMWGTSIVGFDQYHYKSERSKQEGDWPMVGFSPRKQNLTLYFMHGFDEFTALLEKLGKHKISGGSCLYINKLTDVDQPTLERLVEAGYKSMQEKYPA